MLANIKALTFDTGGTILDWHHGISRAFATAGAHRGLQADWPTITNEYRRRSLQAMLDAEHPAFTINDVHREMLDAVRAPDGGLPQLRPHGRACCGLLQCLRTASHGVGAEW